MPCRGKRPGQVERRMGVSRYPNAGFCRLILFDHSVPAPLHAYLKEHAVTEARDRGWDRLSNGELLDAAEAAGFEVLVTADKNIRYQQNLTRRRIAIVELGTPRWPVVLRHVERVVAAVSAATATSYTIPLD